MTKKDKTIDRVWKILLKQAKKVRQGELFIKPKFLKDGGFHE